MSESIEIPTRIRRRRRLKCAYNISVTEPGRKIAAIRFSGMYLEDLGFRHNEWFDLTINDDRSITIKAVSKEQYDQELAAARAVRKTHE